MHIALYATIYTYGGRLLQQKSHDTPCRSGKGRSYYGLLEHVLNELRTYTNLLEANYCVDMIIVYRKQYISYARHTSRMRGPTARGFLHFPCILLYSLTASNIRNVTKP
jgi:hypothetical protein